MGNVVVFCGPHNVGKTTLISCVLPYLVEAGYTVSVVKLTKHVGIFEDKGKDTTRFLKLPSKEVVLVAPDKTAFLVKTSLALEEVLEKLSSDWIICEGFRSAPYPKIAVYRSFDPDYWREVDGVIAVVTQKNELNPWGVPLFSFDQTKELAQFILGLV